VEREEGSPDLHFHLVTARGTSVRALGHDVGRLLGTAAHIAQCRRLAIGGFNVADAWTMDTLIPLIRKYQPGFRDG
jgi:tRNA pseudouridine55 synthase